jgi:hypothetical protein
MRTRTQPHTQRAVAAPGSSNEVKNLITRLRFALAREHVQDPAHYVQEVVGSILNVAPANPTSTTTTIGSHAMVTCNKSRMSSPSTLGRVTKPQEGGNNDGEPITNQHTEHTNSMPTELHPNSARREFKPANELLPFSVRPGRKKRPSSARLQRTSNEVSSGPARRAYQPRPSSARPSFRSSRRVGIATNTTPNDCNTSSETTAQTPHMPTTAARPRQRQRPQSASRYRTSNSVLPSSLQGYLEERISHYESKYGSDVFQRPKRNQRQRENPNRDYQVNSESRNEEEKSVDQSEFIGSNVNSQDSASTFKQDHRMQAGRSVRPATARTRRSFDKHIERQRRAGILPRARFDPEPHTKDSIETGRRRGEDAESGTAPSAYRQYHTGTGPPPRRKTNVAYLHSGDPRLTQRAKNSISRHVEQMNQTRTAKQVVRDTEKRNEPTGPSGNWVLLGDAGKGAEDHSRKSTSGRSKRVYRVLSGWRATVILQRFTRGMLARRLADSIRRNGYGFALAEAATWYKLDDVEPSLSRSSSMSSIDGLDIIG